MRTVLGYGVLITGLAVTTIFSVLALVFVVAASSSLFSSGSRHGFLWDLAGQFAVLLAITAAVALGVALIRSGWAALQRR